MDQGSDLISDFRARRIRTTITWEILSENCHEVTEFRLMRIAGSGTGSAGAGSGNEPSRMGMIWDLFSGIDSPRQASVGHARGFSGACTRLHLPGILGILGILHHQTASFEGAPITTREKAGSQSCDSAACED